MLLYITCFTERFSFTPSLYLKLKQVNSGKKDFKAILNSRIVSGTWEEFVQNPGMGSICQDMHPLRMNWYFRVTGPAETQEV